MAKLLLVEDDPRIVSFIERGLSAEGHVLDVAGTGAAGLALGRTRAYPLMILDRMLPDMDGVEICRQLRQERVGTRILMLTAKDAVGDKIGGLRAGADDYLTKPFSFAEFVARIEALLRRSELHRHEPDLRVGDLMLVPATRQVVRGARQIELTPKEYALLRYLMEHAGAVLSRSQNPQRQLGLRLRSGHQGRRRLHPLPAQEGRRGRGHAADPHRPRRRLLHRRARLASPIDRTRPASLCRPPAPALRPRPGKSAILLRYSYWQKPYRAGTGPRQQAGRIPSQRAQARFRRREAAKAADRQAPAEREPLRLPEAGAPPAAP